MNSPASSFAGAARAHQAATTVSIVDITTILRPKENLRGRSGFIHSSMKPNASAVNALLWHGFSTRARDARTRGPTKHQLQFTRNRRGLKTRATTSAAPLKIHDHRGIR